MKHVWISAEPRGGVRRIKRHLADSVWQGIAFRLPETSRSLATLHIVLQILMNFYTFLLFFVSFVKKWTATRPVSNRLLCFYRTLSAVAAVEAVAAAQQQQLKQYTAAAVHICRAPYLSRGRAGPRVQAGVFRAPKWHCFTPVLSLGRPRRPGI